MDRFLQLMEDLGKLIGLPLLPDHKRCCRLFIDHQIHVQIEDEEAKNRLFIACFICEVPPGKFREKVFKQALKENNTYPRIGTLSYCEKNNSLFLEAHVYYLNLTGDTLGDFLERFTEKAFLWKKGVETGRLPESASKLKPSIFDVSK